MPLRRGRRAGEGGQGDLQAELADLQAALAAAVAQEDFETAARLQREKRRVEGALRLGAGTGLDAARKLRTGDCESARERAPPWFVIRFMRLCADFATGTCCCDGCCVLDASLDPICLRFGTRR